MVSSQSRYGGFSGKPLHRCAWFNTSLCPLWHSLRLRATICFTEWLVERVLADFEVRAAAISSGELARIAELPWLLVNRAHARVAERDDSRETALLESGRLSW
jgi:hypothetical protein